MSIRTSAPGIWGKLRTATGPIEAFWVGLATIQLWGMALYGRLATHPYQGLTSRAEAAAYVDRTHDFDTTTIRGRVAREERIWEILGIAIAIAIGMFVVGILFAEIPDTGNSNFDNASENVSEDIAEAYELAPLVITIVIIVMIVGYVMIMRRRT